MPKKITIEDLALMIKEGFDNVGVRLNNLEVRLTNLETRFEKFEVRLDNLEAGIGKLKTSFDIHRDLSDQRYMELKHMTLREK
jgi:hypothetical protein